MDGVGEASLFLFTREYEEKKVADQIIQCREWLQDNTSTIEGTRMMVERELLHLEEKQELVAAHSEEKQELVAAHSEERQKRLAMSLGSVKICYPMLKDRTLSAPYIPINHRSATVALQEDIVKCNRRSIESIYL